jgi:V8-like Glu-specific endopeptidase
MDNIFETQTEILIRTSDISEKEIEIYKEIQEEIKDDKEIEKENERDEIKIENLIKNEIESSEELKNKLTQIKKQINLIKKELKNRNLSYIKKINLENDLNFFENICHKLKIKLEFKEVEEKYKSINFPCKFISQNFEGINFRDKILLKHLIPMKKENYIFEDNNNDGIIVKNSNSKNSDLNVNGINAMGIKLGMGIWNGFSNGSELNLIGVITSEFKYETYYGTGFFISENAVLTCAHNVYNSNKKLGDNLKFHFYWEKNNDINNNIINNKRRSISIKKIHIPYEFILDPINSLEDYCILILNEKIDNGYFGISNKINIKNSNYSNNNINNNYNLNPNNCNSSNSFLNFNNILKNINSFSEKQPKYLTCGYPFNLFESNNSNSNSNTAYLYQQKIKDLEIYKNTNEIIYKNLSNPIGLSGSPIYFNSIEGKGKIIGNKSSSLIIGIHCRNDNNNSYGVLFTEKRKEIIQKWLLEEKTIVLNLMHSKISIEDFEPLKFYDLTFLKILILNNNNLCEKSMECFSQWKIKFLEILNFDNNNIKSEGLKNLRGINFEYLKEFYISGNNIDNKGIGYLKDFNFLSLEKLFLMRNKIGGKILNEVNYSNRDDNDNNNHNGIEIVEYLSSIRTNDLLEINLSDNLNISKEYILDISLRNELIKVYL